MDQQKKQQILELLKAVPAEPFSTPGDSGKLFDFTVDPFAEDSRFTFLGHVPSKSSREIEDSMVSIGFETMDRDTFDPMKIIPMLGQSGVKYARCQTGWIKCEKQRGVYTFDWLDAIADALLENGIEPWFSVSFGNPLYTPNEEFAALWEKYGEAQKYKIPGPARGYTAEVPLLHGEGAMEGFLNYTKALVEHFKGRVQVYEVWNEPEHFWNCKSEDYAAREGCLALAKNYTELVRRTAEVIRKADPSAKVAANSCGTGNAYINELGECGLGNYIDIYTYHYYGNTPEAALAMNLAQLRACLTVPGRKLELWQGESGRASGHNILVSMPTQYNQSKYMVRRLMADASHGIPLSSIFTASDFRAYYPDGSDQQYGLFTVGETVKPKLGYYVFQGMCGLLEGVAPDPRIMVHFGAPPRVFEDTYDYRFDGAALRRKGVPFFALWRGGNSDIPHAPQYGTVKLCTRAEPEIRDLIAIDPIRRNVYSVEAKLPKPTDIRPAMTLPRFPVLDYPLILTDLCIFEDYLK